MDNEHTCPLCGVNHDEPRLVCTECNEYEDLAEREAEALDEGE